MLDFKIFDTQYNHLIEVGIYRYIILGSVKYWKLSLFHLNEGPVWSLASGIRKSSLLNLNVKLWVGIQSEEFLFSCIVGHLTQTCWCHPLPSSRKYNLVIIINSNLINCKNCSFYNTSYVIGWKYILFYCGRGVKNIVTRSSG